MAEVDQLNESIANQDRDWPRAIFSVVWDPATYLNILYLLISLPLGVSYFVFLVTGFALGLGLAIIWIGLPILLLMLLAVYGLTGFERLLAIHVLDQDIVPMRDSLPEETAWQWLKGILTTPATWKGFFFLLLKMPLGIFSFSLTVTLLAISLSFVLAPIVVLAGGVIDLAFLEVDTLPEALLSSLVGVFLHVIALHILNVLARGWGQLARALLGKTYV